MPRDCFQAQQRASNNTESPSSVLPNPRVSIPIAGGIRIPRSSATPPLLCSGTTTSTSTPIATPTSPGPSPLQNLNALGKGLQSLLDDESSFYFPVRHPPSRAHARPQTPNAARHRQRLTAEQPASASRPASESSPRPAATQHDASEPDRLHRLYPFVLSTHDHFVPFATPTPIPSAAAMSTPTPPIDIGAAPPRFGSSSPRSNLTSALQSAGPTATQFGTRTNLDSQVYGESRPMFGRNDSISNMMDPSELGSGTRPISVKDRPRRESNTAGSLMTGMSWGGISVGSWVREE